MSAPKPPTLDELRQTISNDEALLKRLDMRRDDHRSAYFATEKRIATSKRLLTRLSKPPRVRKPRATRAE